MKPEIVDNYQPEHQRYGEVITLNIKVNLGSSVQTRYTDRQDSRIANDPPLKSIISICDVGMTPRQVLVSVQSYPNKYYSENLNSTQL